MYKKAWIGIVCGLLMGHAQAETSAYQWLDSQGRNHYTDRPEKQARVVKLSPTADHYLVERVFDGDTILLSNGQKVRFLGVNTPEVGGRNKTVEPGGEEAKAWLKQRLEQRRVRLETDVEKQDKYGRSLAYVFTEDGMHINLELLRLGLAAANIFPPNLKYVDVLLAAQVEAEQAKLGIWGRPEYAPLPDLQLNQDNYKGWKRVTGLVRGVKQTKKYSYLQFSDRVSIRIENQWLQLFPTLSSYVGKSLEARGWVMKSKDRYVINVRHSGELKTLAR